MFCVVFLGRSEEPDEAKIGTIGSFTDGVGCAGWDEWAVGNVEVCYFSH